MDRQRTNDTLGSTTAIPQHPGPVDGTRAQGTEDEPREARRNEEAELGQMAQRGAAAARARSAPDDDASDEETTSPGNPQWQGQSVADAPDGVAERGAARAANFMPKRRADETEQPADDDAPKADPMTPDEVRATQELKRQSAVEDHAEARAHGKGTAPRGL